MAVIQAQRQEQASKCEQVQARRLELEQMEGLVGQTHKGLEGERQKALLLVRNFDPALAAELEREFAEET